MTDDVDAKLQALPPGTRTKARQVLRDANRWGAQLDHISIKPHGAGIFVTLHFVGGSFQSFWQADDEMPGGAS